MKKFNFRNTLLLSLGFDPIKYGFSTTKHYFFFGSTLPCLHPSALTRRGENTRSNTCQCDFSDDFYLGVCFMLSSYITFNLGNSQGRVLHVKVGGDFPLYTHFL